MNFQIYNNSWKIENSEFTRRIKKTQIQKLSKHKASNTGTTTSNPTETKTHSRSYIKPSHHDTMMVQMQLCSIFLGSFRALLIQEMRTRDVWAFAALILTHIFQGEALTVGRPSEWVRTVHMCCAAVQVGYLMHAVCSCCLHKASCMGQAWSLFS